MMGFIMIAGFFVLLGLIGYLTERRVTNECDHQYEGPFGTSTVTWAGQPICRKCGQVYGTTRREW